MVDVYVDRVRRQFDEEKFIADMRSALRNDNYILSMDYASIVKSLSMSDINALAGIDVQANCLDRLGEHDLEIECYDEAFYRFGASQDKSVHEEITRLMLNKAITLGSEDKTTEALVVYDAVVQRLSEEASDDAKTRKARALFNRGVTLRLSGRLDAAVRDFEEVIAGFSDFEDAYDIVAKTLRALAALYYERDRFDEALGAYDRYLAFTGDHAGVDEDEVLPMRLNRATVLAALGRADDALAEYDNILTEYSGSVGPMVGRQQAFSLFNKASILVDQQRILEAKGVLQRLVRDFSSSSDSESRNAAHDGARLLEKLKKSDEASR